MEFENFTDRSKGFLQSAQSLALRENHQQFVPIHLLKVLLDDEEGLAANLIKASGGNPKLAQQRCAAELAKLPKVSGGNGQIYLSSEFARLMDQAQEVAKKAGDSYVTAERLLLTIALDPKSTAGKVLADASVTAQSLNGAINDIRKGRTADSSGAESQYDALKKYARDLTEAAREKQPGFDRRARCG